MKNIQLLLLVLCWLPGTMLAQIPSNCERLSELLNRPDYYCECTYLHGDFTLPLELRNLTEPLWYKAYLNDIKEGISAYLYADCEVSFDVYSSCSSSSPRYQSTFKPNQSNSVASNKIAEKLEEEGLGSLNLPFYIKITPQGGTVDRMICTPYNEAVASTCDDPLFIVPGMRVLTSHTNDVFVLDPSDTYHNKLLVKWQAVDSTECVLRISQGQCDGPVFEETVLKSHKTTYCIKEDRMRMAREAGEMFYLHVSYTAHHGKLICSAPSYKKVLTDTTICQGMSFQIGDTVISEPMEYYYDTVHNTTTSYKVLGYNILFAEPELQYDTLALLSTDLPYQYRGETLADYGDYELYLHTDGQCDEHIQLHAYHHITTITNVIDTSFCSIFEYDGKVYDRDVEIVSERWLNADTLLVDTIKARLSEWDVVYDTLGLKYSEVPKKRYRYDANNRIDIPGFGDHTYDIYQSNLCPATLYLHVYRRYDIQTEEQDTTICQGKIFQYNGQHYMADTVIQDTTEIDEDNLLITTTYVHFAAPETQYDTLALRAADLPYQYRGETLTDYGHYDLLLHTDGECDEQVSLYVYHAIDTLTQVIDTVICYGKVFEYKGITYSEPDVLVDTTWLDADTYQHLTIRIWFAEIEQVYDTLALKTTDLPYQYRGETLADFGHYELQLKDEEGCEQLVDLLVYHVIDTIYQTIDTVVCQGKTYEYNGTIYTESEDWVETAWLDADTYQETSISLYFQAPDIQYDTLGLKTTDLPYQYRGEAISNFGTYDLMLHTDGECDEHVLLYVFHHVDVISSTTDTVICYGGVFLYEGTTYTKDVVIVEETQHNADTLFVDTLNVYFDTEPALRYDTLGLKTYDLPYRYNRKTISDFGDYEFDLTTSAGCKEHVLLHVYHDVTVLLEEGDTTLCQGKLYMHNGVAYSEPVTLVDSLWLDADTYSETTTHVWFAEPEMEYDTVTVKTADLQAGYYYAAVDTYIYQAGTYSYVVEKADECTRHITLTVIEDTTSAVENTMVEEQLQLILEDGVVYVLKDGEKYTLLGERL